MNIFEALRKDHDTQRSLLKKLVDTSGDSQTRDEIFKKLDTEKLYMITLNKYNRYVNFKTPNNINIHYVHNLNEILNNDCKICTAKTDLYYSQKIYEANKK